MKETILYILQQIVDHPDDIQIEEVIDGDRKIFVVHANPEDMGTLIGKEGHTIKSIRDLVRAKAIKDNVRVKVVIEDGQKIDDQI